MTTDERIDYLERRVAFLEATLARLLALHLHSADERAGRTKAKARAAAVGSRELLEDALDAALIDLAERADLTASQRMAMPEPRELRAEREADSDSVERARDSE